MMKTGNILWDGRNDILLQKKNGTAATATHGMHTIIWINSVRHIVIFQKLLYYSAITFSLCAFNFRSQIDRRVFCFCCCAEEMKWKKPDETVERQRNTSHATCYIRLLVARCIDEDVKWNRCDIDYYYSSNVHPSVKARLRDEKKIWIHQQYQYRIWIYYEAFMRLFFFFAYLAYYRTYELRIYIYDYLSDYQES